MAPTAKPDGANPRATPNAADTSAPLADYFFIAGIESAQVYDDRSAASPRVPSSVGGTIAEHEPLVTTNGHHKQPRAPASPDTETGKSGARYSFEARKSVGSIATNGDGHIPPSNRSSATVRPVSRANGHGDGDDGGDDDHAFEEALHKFASERDSFLEDIQTSAGAVLPSSANKRARPRTVRIAQDENAAGGGGGLKGSVGSLQRRLSTMKSMKRQPSAMSRQASVRTTKRMSGYNSVIPSPQPFHAGPDMHPLKRRYEPVLLDRYPTPAMVDEARRRNPFPDYVPMFTFPHDVTVVSSDERPRSTWHGFAMTNQDNSKLHGVCVTVWVPLNPAASEGLERQCEEWRRANMSNEERELASSLGERLSVERAKLSRLLAELPGVPSGSDERDALEEAIGAVEEKIGLMTDLLRPVRHGAASKIDGLTEGDTGFWIPRAYGILGRDGGLTGFWKEWLRAVAVPMTNGAVLRVPPSSPKVGIWQPLERYVVNLCVEAPSPLTSITQVEVGVRELRLYARKDALNELPGSRDTDLYALFRCLTVPNVITLLEYALAESRVILLSSHTAMLRLASAALTSLLYPLQWAGVLIPVLPSRLIQALEAPCPYIAGVERRYDKFDLPDDDFCIVDLDENTIESTAPPTALPRPQRRKLQSLLQVAAPHHNRYGVPVGPPPYAVEAFPNDAFSSENTHVFTAKAAPSTLAAYVSESSTTFGAASHAPPHPRAPVFNAFLHSRADSARGGGGSGGGSGDRPSTSSTKSGHHSHSSAHSIHSPIASSSPASTFFPAVPVSRNDSGLALQATLREKRSGNFAEGLTRRNSAVHSLFQARNPPPPAPPASQVHGQRRPSAPLTHTHHPSFSTSTFGPGSGPSNYAPSVYAASTLAASTVMPHVMMQPVRDDERTKWAEGHCLRRRDGDRDPGPSGDCAVCGEKCVDGGDEVGFECEGCGIAVHFRCLPGVTVVCPVAFRADQVRAAFVRCFASLFYTYRRFLQPASGENRRAGMIYHFNMDQFLRSVPHGDGEYMHMLRHTQAFSEFIHERESRLPEDDPRIQLFDEIILSKRNRGRRATLLPFASKPAASFLADTSDHLWRSAAATPPDSSRPDPLLLNTTVAAATSSSSAADGPCGPRVPAKLDPARMKEPRSIHGAPRPQPAGRTRRKPVASMLGLNAMSVAEG